MNRRGASTVELIVVLIVAGVMSSTIGTLLRRQQRFYTRATTLVEHRASLRDATAILPAELRAISPTGGDVLAFSDSSLEIRAAIGAAVICAVAADALGVDLAPTDVSSATVVSAFSTTPQPGDLALIFDSGAPNEADDRWVAREVAGVSSTVDACGTSPLITTEVALVPRLRLRFAGAALTPTSGAFVHVLRRIRYRLYRASTSDWYLGYSEWGGTAFSTVQPVSGPFAAYSRRAGDSGLSLRYFAADGSEVTAGDDVSTITRVEVVARSVDAGGLSTDAASFRDAQDVTVRMRNR